jgi:hypothetical protein
VVAGGGAIVEMVDIIDQVGSSQPARTWLPTVVVPSPAMASPH